MKIAFDIDGVLADNPHYARQVSDWAAFIDAIPNDSVIEEGMALVKVLFRVPGNEVCFITGRPEAARFATTEWLLRNCDLQIKRVSEEKWGADFQLYMRESIPDQDPALFKLETCKIMKSDLVVEDDEESARLLTENGFKVLLFLRKGQAGDPVTQARKSLERQKGSIPYWRYREIVENLPICCVDLIVHVDCRYLLALRANEPEKGQWWFPGGRMIKDESFEEAALRLAKQELSLGIEFERVVGVYNYLSDKSAFSEVSSHGVNVVVLVRPWTYAYSSTIVLDDQHTQWYMADRILEESHEYIRTALFDSGVVK